MADDYSNTIETTGSVAVAGSATATIESAGDRDWIAVELEAGRTYPFNLAASPTGDGTLSDTLLRRILDAEGNKSTGDGAHASYNDDFGGTRNSRVTFTATQSGIYYVETSGDRDETGTYTLSVTDVTPAPAADPDAERTGARDLGDLTALPGARFHHDTVDGTGDSFDYYRFTPSEARTVELGLRRQDADADLFLEDTEGDVVAESTRNGAANDALRARLESAPVVRGPGWFRQSPPFGGRQCAPGVRKSEPGVSVPKREALRCCGCSVHTPARLPPICHMVSAVRDLIVGGVTCARLAA